LSNCPKQKLEGEQERRGKIKKQMRAESINLKAKQYMGTKATIAIVSSLA